MKHKLGCIRTSAIPEVSWVNGSLMSTKRLRCVCPEVEVSHEVKDWQNGEYNIAFLQNMHNAWPRSRAGAPYSSLFYGPNYTRLQFVF